MVTTVAEHSALPINASARHQSFVRHIAVFLRPAAIRTCVPMRKPLIAD